MVALSVSISAITSPALTVSPTFTCHLASVPSSMVGESAGIRTSVTAARLQCRRRCRARTDPARALVRANSAASATMRLHLGVDGLQRRPRRPSLASPAAPRRWSIGSRVLRTSSTSSGPVLGRVAHRVAAVAVGLHLQDVGPLARAGVLGGACAPASRTASTSMPSTCSPGMPKRGAALVEVGLGRRALDRWCPWRTGCSRSRRRPAASRARPC